MSAVERYQKVAVRSGHKVGKSNCAALLALWWYMTREQARVIMTSATGKQVKEILWREVRAMYANRKEPIPGKIHIAPANGLVADDGRQIIGFTSDEKENMAGYSGPNVLYIVDEASGVPEDIFEAIEGNRAGGAKIVIFSNPTKTSGAFYNAFHSKREFWHGIKISCEDSPNITGERSIPGLAVREWVDEMRREHGDPSPFYDVRIRGDFPSQAENCVIGIGLVEAARADWRNLTDADGRLEIGVDVGRFGDDETIVQPRRGKYMAPPRAFRSMDSVDVAGHVLRVARELRMDGEKPRVKVDVIGIGAGVVDHLARHRDIETLAINVSESATCDTYHRLRDQLWFATRDWLKDGGKLPEDSKLHADLVAPTYGFDAKGAIKVQSKDDIKKTLHRSPDRGDAASLSIYSPPQRSRASATSYLSY